MADSYACLVICHLFFYSALLSPFLANNSCVYGASLQETMNHDHKEMKSFIPAHLTSTKGCLGKFQDVEIVDRDGTKKSPPNSEQNNIVQEKYRSVEAIMKSLKVVERKLLEYGEGIYLPLTLGSDNDNFVVTVGFGTPKRDFTLLFDSGSDLTWIPCQPNTNTPLYFDPSSSSTFSNATCNPSCDYNKHYHDGSSSTGYYASDTLTITSDHIPNFIFGCAQRITGDFRGATGLLGVGRGNYSLIAQTDVNFFSTFCYCLPPTKSSSGYIVFGVQAYETCQPEPNQLIPIVAAPNQIALTSYYITLTGITIGQTRLDIASYVSSSKSLQAIVDSGTIISRLPPSLYSALRSVFQEIMSQYSPANSSTQSFLDTCYSLDGHNNWTPPKMVLHFEGNVDVKLDSSAATTTGTSDSEVCLAFAGNKNDNDLIIIGNQQHRALNLFFDTHNGMLGFVTGGCTDISQLANP